MIELYPNFINETSAATDQWGNPLPPTDPIGYGPETPGDVFRYSDGSVSIAEGYSWGRPGSGQPGYIYSIVHGTPDHYKTQTVFACSPLLPLIVTGTDPSVNMTYFRSVSNYDISALADVGDDGSTSGWSMLHFRHPPEVELRAVSQAALGSSGRLYVVGRAPSWIPSLVPDQFSNTRREHNIPQSVGLSGELPLVIALMAFWDDKNNRPGDVFRRGLWQDRRWNSRHPAAGCERFYHSCCYHRVPLAHSKVDPDPEDSPRGLLVQVCLDNLENPETSTPELLRGLEWYAVLVQG